MRKQKEAKQLRAGYMRLHRVSRAAAIAQRFARHSSVRMTSKPRAHLIFLPYVASQILYIAGISVFHGYMLYNHSSDI